MHFYSKRFSKKETFGAAGKLTLLNKQIPSEDVPEITYCTHKSSITIHRCSAVKGRGISRDKEKVDCHHTTSCKDKI
jgi:hypothetical protein